MSITHSSLLCCPRRMSAEGLCACSLSQGVIQAFWPLILLQFLDNRCSFIHTTACPYNHTKSLYQVLSSSPCCSKEAHAQ